MNLVSERYNSTQDAGVVTVSEFDRAYIFQKENNLDRLAKATRRYFPINNGKWDQAALETMREEYRQPTQFDITGVKVDTLAGSLIADLPDPTWSPVMGAKSILTEAIAESWYRDRELCNYDDVLLKVFRDGLVQAGDLHICECYDNHTPNIAFKRRLPGRVIWDPYWETDDDRDAMVAYVYDYMTPDKLIDTYRFATDEIRMELERYRRDKSNFPMDNSQKKDPFYRTKIGDEFQVIEKHYVELIRTTRLIGRPYDSEEFIPFPINKPEAYLKAFGDQNDIDWETVYEDTYSDKVHKVTTVVRELTKAEIQVEKKSKIQTMGLPFYHFTTMRHAGQDMGLPEAMAGVEDTINKRESLVTELIAKANGGSDLVNENLFKGDRRKFAEWMKKKNKPGHSELVDLDSVKTAFIKMSATQFPSTVVDQITRMYETVMPIVSRVSNALASVSESSDSGILFERKFQTNMIANTLMNRGMRQFINNIAEGYFYQWQITYDGYQHDVEFRDGRKVTLNKKVGDITYNSVKSVPRCKVVITENKKSMTYQMRWRSVWAEMLTTIDPNVSLPHYVLALDNFFKTIEMNDEDKAQAEMIGEMMMVQARLDTVSKITALQTQTQSNTLQGAQIEAQLNMLMSQLAATQQQPPPVSHAEQPTRTVNYPQGEQIQPVNQSAIDAASEGAQIPPAEIGEYQ